MVEAELKARVRDPERVRRLLRDWSVEEAASYKDTYYDRPSGELHRTGRELRLRTIWTEHGVHHLLTFKGAPMDDVSQSKPEHETEVAEREPVEATLRGLGFEVWVRFTKRVVNYRFSVEGRGVVASIVTVPELQGTFLEVGSMAEAGEVGPVLGLLRRVVAELGIQEADLTTERYDESVIKASS